MLLSIRELAIGLAERQLVELAIGLAERQVDEVVAVFYRHPKHVLQRRLARARAVVSGQRATSITIGRPISRARQSPYIRSFGEVSDGSCKARASSWRFWLV